MKNTDEQYEDDGPFWPDFVVEDYQIVVGMVGRYALYTGVPEFTFGQLEGHLIRLNVELVGELDWPTLFSQMRNTVVQNLAEQGRDFQWRQRKVGEVTKYALMEVPSSKEAVSPEEELPDVIAEAEVGQQDEIPLGGRRPDARLDTLFEGLPDRRARLKDLPSMIMQRFGVDETEAQGMIHAARADGRLHRSPVAGITYLSLDPPSKPATRSHQEARQEDAEQVMRSLTEYELIVAERIMDSLAASGTHVSEGSTIKRLGRDLNLDLSPRDLRRLLRHMETMRLISIDSSGGYGQTRKSPRVRIRGQDMKNRWNGNKNGYMGRLGKSQMPG
jgi:hypothetical protein